MAQRQSTTRFDSRIVQGDGSYVVLTPLTVGEAKALYKTSKPTKDENGDSGELMEVSFDTITSHITDWDWVDYDGNPLPLPKNDPGIVDRLNVDEIKFLAECLTGRDAKKNLAGGSKHT